ncbi:MAG: Dyp-type peroxidase [Planctomycetota bacterium]
MSRLDRSDIQGILLHGYGRMRGASFLLAEIQDPDACRSWLARAAGRVTDASGPQEERCFNLAFTHAGLARLGVAERLSGLSREFVEGMTAPHRQRILGDHPGTPSDPRLWAWGGTEERAQPVHLLLMLYALTPSAAARDGERVAAELADHGMRVSATLDSNPLKDGKEHFGFRDGISNPRLTLDPAELASQHAVMAGEFVLGYPNQARVLPQSPRLGSERGESDWGRNGSYLVFRQLSQDVELFWETMQASSRQLGRNATHDDAKWVASKMVGRWPNGRPLTASPDSDEGELRDLNDFAFHESDADGQRCPLGAHIRRTNPRDSLRPGPKGSLEFVKSHRILRRGRTYGSPVASAARPPAAATASEFPDRGSTDERGLLFLCFNTDLRGQFEFMQQTWMNNEKFQDAYRAVDPVAGVHSRRRSITSTNFIVPDTPLRRRVTDIPSFVSVRGGAYFFLPGLAALRALSG